MHVELAVDRYVVGREYDFRARKPGKPRIDGTLRVGFPAPPTALDPVTMLPRPASWLRS